MTTSTSTRGTSFNHNETVISRVHSPTRTETMATGIGLDSINHNEAVVDRQYPRALASNHNETVAMRALTPNHNETVVGREHPLTSNHSETVVRVARPATGR